MICQNKEVNCNVWHPPPPPPPQKKKKTEIQRWAVEGTGAEMRTSGQKSRPTGDQEWKEHGLVIHNVHIVEAVVRIMCGGRNSGDRDMVVGSKT